VKPSRRLAILPALFALVLIASACVGTVNPEGWAAPVFEGKDMYFLQSHNRLARAPVPSDGKTNLSWVFPDKNNSAEKNDKLQAVYGEPIVANGAVYLTSYSGGVFALDQATGKPKWGLKDGISGNIVGGAAIGNGLLAFGTTDGHFYVVNASDGKSAPNWPKDGIHLSDGVWAAPIVKGDTLYVGTMGGNLYAYSLSKGPDNPIWEEPFHAAGGGAIADLAMLDDTHMFVPSINHHVYVLDISNAKAPKTRVDFTASDWVWTKPAFKDNIMYFGDFSGHIYAVDITAGPNGKMLWPAPASAEGNRVKSAPAIVDNVLVVADRKPTVRFIDLQSGKQLNAVPLNGSGTVRADLEAHDGVVYVVTTNGSLFIAHPDNRSVTQVQVGGRQ
jgi:outer membrane protein assembly factor BamB